MVVSPANTATADGGPVFSGYRVHTVVSTRRARRSSSRRSALALPIPATWCALQQPEIDYQISSSESKESHYSGKEADGGVQLSNVLDAPLTP